MDVTGRFQGFTWKRRVQMGGRNSRKLSGCQAGPCSPEMRPTRETHGRWGGDRRPQRYSFKKGKRSDWLQAGPWSCEADPRATIPWYVLEVLPLAIRSVTHHNNLECSAKRNRGVNEAFTEAARVALSVKASGSSSSSRKCTVMWRLTSQCYFHDDSPYVMSSLLSTSCLCPGFCSSSRRPATQKWYLEFLLLADGDFHGILSSSNLVGTLDWIHASEIFFITCPMAYIQMYSYHFVPTTLTYSPT